MKDKDIKSLLEKSIGDLHRKEINSKIFENLKSSKTLKKEKVKNQRSSWGVDIILFLLLLLLVTLVSIFIIRGEGQIALSISTLLTILIVYLVLSDFVINKK